MSNKYRKFIAFSNTFKDLPDGFRERVAGIFEKYFDQPIEAAVSFNRKDLKNWIQNYPNHHDTLWDNCGKKYLAQSLAFRTCLDMLVEIDRFWKGAGKLDASEVFGELVNSGIIYVRADTGIKDKLLISPSGNDYILVQSSMGNVYADREGNVKALDESWKEADERTAIPVKFDFEEFKEYWKEEVPDAVDILDLGFLAADGNCIAPDEDARQLIAEQRAEQKQESVNPAP